MIKYNMVERRIVGELAIDMRPSGRTPLRGYAMPQDIRLSSDGTVFFVHLAAPFEVLRTRMESREHFMPPSLLQSQFDTLEPLGADEPGAVLDVSQPLDAVVRAAEGAVRAG